MVWTKTQIRPDARLASRLRRVAGSVAIVGVTAVLMHIHPHSTTLRVAGVLTAIESLILFWWSDFIPGMITVMFDTRAIQDEIQRGHVLMAENQPAQAVTVYKKLLNGGRLETTQFIHVVQFLGSALDASNAVPEEHWKTLLTIPDLAQKMLKRADTEEEQLYAGLAVAESYYFRGSAAYQTGNFKRAVDDAYKGLNAFDHPSLIGPFSPALQDICNQFFSSLKLLLGEAKILEWDETHDPAALREGISSLRESIKSMSSLQQTPHEKLAEARFKLAWALAETLSLISDQESKNKIIDEVEALLREAESSLPQVRNITLVKGMLMAGRGDYDGAIREYLNYEPEPGRDLRDFLISLAYGSSGHLQEAS